MPRGTAGTTPRRPRFLASFSFFSGSTPRFLPIALDQGAITVGRGEGPFSVVTDDRLSRRHAEIRFLPGRGWHVRDCGSRNGTFVDGQAVDGSATVAAPRVIRVADTLLVPCDDLRTVSAPTTTAEGIVIGSRLGAALTDVGRAAMTSSTLLLRGESGTGKELAARTFHARGPCASGPLVAVNCAAIPGALAERLLFGTKRGAYSGAAQDARGHVQEADGGVLFLDEGGELAAEVQAKLLRVLETREVVPLGASHGHAVDVRVCVATHRDLRSAVAAGTFRADLYHRIAPPEVVLPPLRERTDEIAHHVAAEIALVSGAISPHVRLVEACLLRLWPGNVRELRKEIRTAALRARADGEPRVRLDHLTPSAGLAFDPTITPGTTDGALATARQTRANAAESSSSSATSSSSSSSSNTRGYVRWSQTLTREDIERALAAHHGSVVNAARSLGMGRTQLYREMKRWHVLRPSLTTNS